MPDATYLTVGEAAMRLHCLEWRLRRVFERGLLPEPLRLGRYRLIPVADLPKIQKAMEDVGYLPAKR